MVKPQKPQKPQKSGWKTNKQKKTEKIALHNYFGGGNESKGM
jgi:hypothetical protein